MQGRNGRPERYREELYQPREFRRTRRDSLPRYHEYARMPRERQRLHDGYYRRYAQGQYDSRSSSSDSSVNRTVRKGKTRSGINARPSSSVQDQLRYPHFSLGQVSGFIGMNLQFHQLSFEQFIAGELETIHTCLDQEEQWGRIELLHHIVQWNLRSNVSWPQIRNTYAHILRKIENREITWNADWDRYERFIYDKITTTNKAEKVKIPVPAKPKPDITWFCKAYQKVEGCARESPHPGRIGNQFRQLHHICASCWMKEKVKRYHPECSPDCPTREM